MVGTKDKLGAINNAVVDELKSRNILISQDPNDHSNDFITGHLAEHLQTVANLEHFGDEGSKGVKAKTLNDLAIIINDRRAEAKLELVTREQITEAVNAGWKKVAGELKYPTVNITDTAIDTQDKLGAINNAVVDGFKDKKILIHSNPEDRSNDDITRLVARHLQAVLNAKHFGDADSKNTESKTLNDLTGVINGRRDEANLKQPGLNQAPVTKEQVTDEVVAGWNKVVAAQQNQQQSTAKPVGSWSSEELLRKQMSLYNEPQR